MTKKSMNEMKPNNKNPLTIDTKQKIMRNRSALKLVRQKLKTNKNSLIFVPWDFVQQKPQARLSFKQPP